MLVTPGTGTDCNISGGGGIWNNINDAEKNILKDSSNVGCNLKNICKG